MNLSSELNDLADTILYFGIFFSIAVLFVVVPAIYYHNTVIPEKATRRQLKYIIPLDLRYLISDGLFVIYLTKNTIFKYFNINIAGASSELYYASYGSYIPRTTSINFMDFNFLASIFLPFKILVPKCFCITNNLAHAKTYEKIPLNLIIFSYLDAPSENEINLPEEDIKEILVNVLSIDEIINGLIKIHEKREREREQEREWERQELIQSKEREKDEMILQREEIIAKLKAEIKGHINLLEKQDDMINEQAKEINELKNTLKKIAEDEAKLAKKKRR